MTSAINYAEPIYPLTKREMFDEENMKPLLTDENFNKKDRERLSNYNKHRVSGSRINVSYRFGLGCEEEQLGRLFPDDGIGLQSFRFDIRNPLAKKYYWDLDCENAHYRIALRFCERYDIKKEKLEYYVNNRNDCLKMVSNSRKKSKTEFLKILYGGDIKLYSESFYEMDGELTQEGITFLRALEKEVAVLMNMVWNNYPDLHKLKTGKDKKPIAKKQNPKASLMSLIFQTEERKILMFLDWLLAQRGRYMAVFIHDGGYVEKLEGETQFPKEILDECSAIITEHLKYKTTITQKEIEYDWKPPACSLTTYQIRKQEFEKNNFLVGSTFVNIHSDGYVEYIKPNDMKTRLRNNNYKEYVPETDKYVKKYFYDSWLDDSERATFERIDFNPDIENCPPTIYNLFKGFKAEKFKPETPMTNIEIASLVKPILRHIDYLTTGNQIWFIKWLANIIQNPSKKSEVGCLIRDEGGLLLEGGGTGKNLLLEWFGNEILGEEYVYVVGDNKEMYGDFNSQFEGKLLVIVEEASSKENHGNNDILKSKITSKKINVNKKMIAQYSVKDYANWIFCSNNRNPLPIKQGNRRIAVCDTNPEMRGNIQYFTALDACLGNPMVKWAFYQYLKTVKTYSSPIEFQNSIPNTAAYREVRMLNAPLYLKWILYELRNGTLKNGTTTELYEEFRCWIKRNREGNEESMIGMTAFGLLLNKSKEANNDYVLEEQGNKAKNSKGCMFMDWNIEGVIKGLQNLFLLEKDFKYETKFEYSETDGEDST